MTETTEKPEVGARPYSFFPEDHTYFDDGGWAPSATQILDRLGFTDLSGIPWEVLERKRAIGDLFHKATQFIDTPSQGELDWDSVPPNVLPYVLAWECFCEAWQFKPRLVEFGGIAKTKCGRVGFTLDREGTVFHPDRKCALPVIVDLKSAAQPGYSWRTQTSIYELALESFGFKPNDLVAEWKYPGWVRMAVQCKPDGTFVPHIFDVRRDRQVAEWAVALATEQINAGLWKAPKVSKTNP